MRTLWILFCLAAIAASALQAADASAGKSQRFADPIRDTTLSKTPAAAPNSAEIGKTNHSK